MDCDAVFERPHVGSASEEVRPCDRQAANRDRLSQLSRHFSIGHNRDQVERSLVIPSLACRLNVARTDGG